MGNIPMRRAEGVGQGVWFVKVEGFSSPLPNVWNYWAKVSESECTYDDEWIKWKEDTKGQLPAYIKAIKEGIVCHTVGRPIDPKRPLVFTRLGYDSVWKIIPDVLNEKTIRFRFKEKLCDLFPRASVVAILLSTASANAANIYVDPSAQEIVVIKGDIQEGDFDKFKSVVNDKTNGVVLNSDGGSLIDGLKIGEYIRNHKLSTGVNRDAGCFSVCALAWLGGVARYSSPTAHIGFHAAYHQDQAVSSTGNAVIGAYLRDIGMSYAAIVKLTDAAPTELMYLDDKKANELGITFSFINDDGTIRRNHPNMDSSIGKAPAQPVYAPVPIPAPAPARSDDPYLFVLQYFKARHDGDLGTMRSLFTSEPFFYNKKIGASALMIDLDNHFKRWPVREYSSIIPSSNVCDATTCTVELSYDWKAVSNERNAVSNGRAAMRVVLLKSITGGYQISSITERILQNKLARLHDEDLAGTRACIGPFCFGE